MVDTPNTVTTPEGIVLVDETADVAPLEWQPMQFPLNLPQVYSEAAFGVAEKPKEERFEEGDPVEIIYSGEVSYEGEYGKTGKIRLIHRNGRRLIYEVDLDGDEVGGRMFYGNNLKGLPKIPADGIDNWV